MSPKSIVCLFFILSSSVFAQSTDSSWTGQGEVVFEYRHFEDDNIKSTEDMGLSLFTRVEAVYEKETWKHVFRGFGRVDRKDTDRDIFAIEDANFSKRLGEEENFKVTAGYKIFNWTATEGFHPADVINSRNYDSDIENLDKLGELTFEVNRYLESGSLNFYLWPRFENPKFPGSKSRLGTGATVSRPYLIDGTTATRDPWVLQGGVMVNTTIGDADINLHLLHHIDRNMPLVGSHETQYLTIPTEGTFLTYANNVTELARPYYFMVNQAGGTYQHALGGWMLKVEAAYRTYVDDTKIGVPTSIHSSTVLSKQIPVLEFKTPKDHTEAAFGIEYVLAHEESGSETNFILEGTGIFGPSKIERAAMSVFQRDIMFGLRHAFNDEMGTEIFASFFTDIERDHEYLFNFSFTRRLTDVWKVKTGVRYYDAPVKGSTPKGLETLHRDNHIFFNLLRYF